MTPFIRTCAHCGRSYPAKSDKSRYCGTPCRMKAYRRRKARQAKAAAQ